MCKLLAFLLLIAVLLPPKDVFAWRPFGGGYKQQVSASDIDTVTTNFNNNLNSTHTDIQKALDALDDAVGGGGGAPTNATYITQTANATLSAEQALASLSSGIMRVATTTGVVTSLTDSAGIAANISDETGTTKLVFSDSPTLTTATTFSFMTAGSVFFAGTGGLLNQDNANLFFDDTTNRVGIGTNTPDQPLHVVNDSADTGIKIEGDAQKRLTVVTHSNTASSSSGVVFDRSQGVDTGQLTVANGDRIGHVFFRGYDGDSYENAAGITADVDGAVSDGVVPMGFTWYTGSSLATRLARLNITSAGAFNYGDGSQASITSTYNLSGTDPVLTAVSGGFAVTGTFDISSTLQTGSGNINITNATGNLDGTKVADADLGDIGVSSGVWSVEDDSHTHGASTLNTDSVSADELNATGVEAELEAVLDLQDLQGAVTDLQVPNDITASNYLPLAGGTLTGQLVTDNLGIEFDESDTNPSCAAGNFNIYADLSENKLKKCMNGVASDMDTTGAGATGTVNTIKENAVQVGDADIVTLDFLGADFDLSETPDTEINLIIAAALTRDAEWDTEGEVQTAWGSVNILLETEIDAGSELAALLDDETGSGVPVFSTSPALTTPTIGNGATAAGHVDFLEDSDNGTNYIRLIGVASIASNKTLTLPDATDTLVGKDTTDTLTNKTLAAASNVIDADTSVALAANGGNCSAGAFPLGVDASGAAESCTAQNAGTDITADLEEDAHCSEHDSGDLDCSGETLIYAADSIDFTEILQSNTLAGNPALAVDECFFMTTASGGGFICEGSTDDTNEQLYLFPDLNGADTTKRIMVDDTEISGIDDASLEVSSGTLRRAALTGDVTAAAGSNTTVIADSVTVTDWTMGASVATTPSVDDNDTSLGTTAYVQTEINAMGGRSLSASSGSMDADAELYTDAKCITIDPTHSVTQWVMWRAPHAVTITGVDCRSENGTSVVLTPQECDANGANCVDIEAAITCATTNTTEATSVDNGSIDAGDWIEVTRGTNTGSSTQVSLCLEYTVND